MTMNSLCPIYYRVTINGAPFVSNNDGFIDNDTPQVWAAVTGKYPSDIDASYRKGAANFRWQEIVQQLSINATPIIECISKAGSPDHDTAPTSISFTVCYDREETVYAYENGDLVTGTDAIKYQVATAMTSEIAPSNAYFYVPSVIGSGKGANPIGPSIYQVGASKLTSNIETAKSAITVTVIENV